MYRPPGCNKTTLYPSCVTGRRAVCSSSCGCLSSPSAILCSHASCFRYNGETVPNVDVRRQNTTATAKYIGISRKRIRSVSAKSSMPATMYAMFCARLRMPGRAIRPVSQRGNPAIDHATEAVSTSAMAHSVPPAVNKELTRAEGRGTTAAGRPAALELSSQSGQRDR